MDLLVVKVGSQSSHADAALAAELRSLGAGSAEIAHVGADSVDIDGVLSSAQGRRLLLDTDLAGLSLVLHRLHRRGELDVMPIAVVGSSPIPYLTRLGLPGGRAAQVRLAVTGNARLVGVIKDDSGGICIDSAVLTPWPGPDQGWWVRAVVDDQRLCDDQVRELEVRKIGPAELEATVQLSRFRRRTCRGRSLQLASDPALIVADGIARERPRSKRTFWSEPTLLNLVLP